MERTIQKLELHAVLAQAAEYAVSPVAKAACLALQPSSDRETVLHLLEETTQAYVCINKLDIRPNFSFDSVQEIAEKAKVLSLLGLGDLLKVMRMLRVSRGVQAALNQNTEENLSILKGMCAAIFLDKALEDDIDRCVENEMRMHDKASAKLFSVRQKIRKANDDVKAKLQQYIKAAENQKFLQDAFVTVREGRFVLPVKTEYKNNIQGLVHDMSGSGSTVFIEPMAVVNLNNEIKILMIEESQEVERILREFTVRISAVADALILNEQTVCALDVIFARAEYASKTKSIRPEVNGRGFLQINKGRHPLLNPNTVVPVTITLGGKFDLLVVTGPNTGGKTVSMKTAGLFVLMTGCGMFLPCGEGSEVSVFDAIYCDIGDEQSISQNLSTFSGHMTNIAQILKNITPKSLVLLDELGAGTEPNEGAALALAITEFLLQSGCKGIITTHYSALKEFSLVHDRIENASMEFNLKTLAPTYKLIVGVPGSSNAIEIASRLGLSDEIISNARTKLSDDKIAFENILVGAEKLRQEYETNRDSIERLKTELETEKAMALKQNELLAEERDKLLKGSRTQSKRIVAETQEEAKKLIAELKEIIKRSGLEESAIFEARKRLKDFEKSAIETDDEEIVDLTIPVNISELRPGDRVYVKPLSSEGTVLAAVNNRQEVEVLAGKSKLFLTQDKLALLPRKQQQKQQTRQKSNISSTSNKRDFRPEIILLGQTVDEASANLDIFIDQCLLSGISEARIIHGMGTGALRKGVHIYLKNHPSVTEFRLGAQNEGASGATIITLNN